MSCDNLAANGPKLRSALLTFARELNRSDLAAWIEVEVRFPATMVDSITPASRTMRCVPAYRTASVPSTWRPYSVSRLPSG